MVEAEQLLCRGAYPEGAEAFVHPFQKEALIGTPCSSALKVGCELAGNPEIICLEERRISPKRSFKGCKCLLPMLIQLQAIRIIKTDPFEQNQKIGTFPYLTKKSLGR
jgi:hypothetical protein